MCPALSVHMVMRKFQFYFIYHGNCYRKELKKKKKSGRDLCKYRVDFFLKNCTGTGTVHII